MYGEHIEADGVYTGENPMHCMPTGVDCNDNQL